VIQYGTGCPGSRGQLGARTNSTPYLGNAAFRYGVTNAPPTTTAAVFFAGARGQLRFDGCDLLVDAGKLQLDWGRGNLAHLADRAPGWLKPLVGSGRYVLLGVLFNVPGNAFIGGGGGIAFIAGFSRLFRPVWTAFVIVLAVLPVPLTVWLTGSARLLF